MPKAVIRLGYNDYVVDVEDALRIAQTLTHAPRYEAKGWGDATSYHIWEQPNNEFEIKIISDETVRIATMAGKYEDK
jgi:hypothetical protein